MDTNQFLQFGGVGGAMVAPRVIPSVIPEIAARDDEAKRQALSDLSLILGLLATLLLFINTRDN